MNRTFILITEDDFDQALGAFVETLPNEVNAPPVNVIAITEDSLGG